MLANPILSEAEFASLIVAAKGPFPVPGRSIAHCGKLSELKLIAEVPGGFTMTSAGRFKIAVGS